MQNQDHNRLRLRTMCHHRFLHMGLHTVANNLFVEMLEWPYIIYLQIQSGEDQSNMQLSRFELRRVELKLVHHNTFACILCV